MKLAEDVVLKRHEICLVVAAPETVAPMQPKPSLTQPPVVAGDQGVGTVSSESALLGIAEPALPFFAADA